MGEINKGTQNLVKIIIVSTKAVEINNDAITSQKVPVTGLCI